jgi:cell division protein FtsB
VAKPGAVKPKPASKRSASRAPASRPATSNRPRPGAGGRSAGPGSGVRTGLGRPLWVLAAVAVVLALLVLPYVQKLMVQQREIAAVEAENAKARREVAALETERRRWQDPDYVKAEARRQLFYVMPGETGFVVVDSQPAPKTPADPAHAAAARVKNGDRPWFGDLWDSLQVAGATPPDDGR